MPFSPPDQFLSLGMELEPYLDQEGLAAIRQEIIKEFGGKSKPRIARILGGMIEPEQIPPKFIEVFELVKSLY